MGLQRRLLTGTELLRPTGLGSVAEPVGTLGMETPDGIVPSLTLHPLQPRRLGSRRTLERIGNRQQPQDSPGIPLAGSSLA